MLVAHNVIILQMLTYFSVMLIFLLSVISVRIVRQLSSQLFICTFPLLKCKLHMGRDLCSAQSFYLQESKNDALGRVRAQKITIEGISGNCTHNFLVCETY